MSWNVHGCVGVDRRFDPDRTARVLRALAPDVALLQEVGDNLGVHPPVDQARTLADALGMISTLGITLERSPYGYGNVTLTRGAVIEAGTWDLSVRGREPRVCLCVEVNGPADGARIVTANVHLGLGRRERRAQLEILLDEIGPFGGVPTSPTVVGGDFNDWPPGPVTQALEAEFDDAARAGGRAPDKTFPSRRPLIRIDRLYVGGGVTVRECRVDGSPDARLASDHLPVVADLALAALRPR